MSVDEELHLQSLSGQKQPSLLLPLRSPSRHGGDDGGGVRDVAGDESEKLDKSNVPSASRIDVVSRQDPPSFITPMPKKGPRRRKKDPRTPKQRATANRRLDILTKNFRPIPFSPGKTLDFSAHENIFRELGLWNFAHLKLDSKVRSDLLIHLISYYEPAKCRSYVNDVRISVNRTFLARALGLPVKKVKENALECTDETTCILLDFISNYMPYGDDMCILPGEIMQATQFIKEGVPQKVDWAALMWVLVEKELLDAPNSGICHCASHLQCLIKHQKPSLFQNDEVPVLEPIFEAEGDEILVVDAEVCATDGEGNVKEDRLTDVKEGDDCNDSSSMEMRILEDLGNGVLEKNNGELPLPLGEEENMMDGIVEEEEDELLLEKVKDEGFEHCLQRCSSVVAEGIGFENFSKVDEPMGQEMKYSDDFSTKFSNLEVLSAPDLLQAMGNATYDQEMNSFNAHIGEFLTVGTESHKNMLGHGSSVCLYSGNDIKRQACAMSDVGGEHFQLNHQKRMRSSEPWGNLPLSPYELMEEMQGNAERVKMLYAEKKQALVNMQMQIQYLNHALQEKEQAIHSLKSTIEDQQHGRMVVRHYEHELNLMTKMLLGYKKSLKDTRIKFVDYKRKHSQDDETVNKDVPRTDGLREFEQQRLAREEEIRQKLLFVFGILENVLMRFEECQERIILHNRKLGELAGEVKQLKERSPCFFTKAMLTS